MKRAIGILMVLGLMMGVWSGCGKEVKVDVDGMKVKMTMTYTDSEGVKREGNIKGTFVDGKWEGDYVMYLENGKVGMEGNYKNGKPEGKWIFYITKIIVEF